MNVVTTGSPARILTVPDVNPAGLVDRDRRPDRSWFWTLVEALANMGPLQGERQGQGLD